MKRGIPKDLGNRETKIRGLLAIGLEVFPLVSEFSALYVELIPEFATSPLAGKAALPYQHGKRRL